MRSERPAVTAMAEAGSSSASGRVGIRGQPVRCPGRASPCLMKSWLRHSGSGSAQSRRGSASRIPRSRSFTDDHQCDRHCIGSSPGRGRNPEVKIGLSGALPSFNRGDNASDDCGEIEVRCDPLRPIPIVDRYDAQLLRQQSTRKCTSRGSSLASPAKERRPITISTVWGVRPFRASHGPIAERRHWAAGLRRTRRAAA